MKPKKPKSAYFHYLDYRRPAIKEKHPKLKMTDRQKIMATEWREMDPANKKVFEDLAHESKLIYAKDLKKYQDWIAKQSSRRKESKEERTPEKVISRPKKAVSAFLHYLSRNRASMKSNKPGDVMKVLSAKWKGLKDEEKKEYEELALKDKERFKSEMAEYERLGGKEIVDPLAVVFPLAKVKRIIQLDQTITKISKEATWLITKAAEGFVGSLAKKAQQEAARSGRKGLTINDLEVSLRKHEDISFLREPMMRYVRRTNEERKKLNELNLGKKKKKAPKEPEKGKYKTRTITSMFAPKPKKPKHGQDRNDYNNDESKEDAMAVESDRKVSAA